MHTDPDKRHSISRRSMGHFFAAMAVGLAGPSFGADAPQRATGKSAWSEDHDAIEQLLHRHAMAQDQRDVNGLVQCFAPGVLKPAVAEKVIAFYSRFEFTLHSILNHGYRIEGDQASGTAFCIVTFIQNVAGKRTQFETLSQFKADRLIKKNDQWLFLAHHRTSLYSTPAVPVIEGDPPEVTQAAREIFGGG